MLGGMEPNSLSWGDVILGRAKDNKERGLPDHIFAPVVKHYAIQITIMITHYRWINAGSARIYTILSLSSQFFLNRNSIESIGAILTKVSPVDSYC